MGIMVTNWSVHIVMAPVSHLYIWILGVSILLIFSFDIYTFLEYIRSTSFYGWLRLLMWGELIDLSLSILFTKTTTIRETMDTIC